MKLSMSVLPARRPVHVRFGMLLIIHVAALVCALAVAEQHCGRHRMYIPRCQDGWAWGCAPNIIEQETR